MKKQMKLVYTSTYNVFFFFRKVEWTNKLYCMTWQNIQKMFIRSSNVTVVLPKIMKNKEISKIVKNG